MILPINWRGTTRLFCGYAVARVGMYKISVKTLKTTQKIIIQDKERFLLVKTVKRIDDKIRTVAYNELLDLLNSDEEDHSD